MITGIAIPAICHWHSVISRGVNLVFYYHDHVVDLLKVLGLGRAAAVEHISARIEPHRCISRKNMELRPYYDRHSSRTLIILSMTKSRLEILQELCVQSARGTV